jgi:transcriptional antiterminator NusG
VRKPKSRRGFVEPYDLDADRTWISDDKRWYAGRVRSGQEDKVAERLRKKGIYVFIPKIKVDGLKTRGRPRMRPLFPGYLFMKTSMNERIWFRITRTTGFIGLLGIRNKPLPIPEEEMNPLFEVNGKRKEEIFSVPVNPGQKLRVIRGPFMGKEGICKEVSAKKGIIRMEIEVFRDRKDLVELNIGDVEQA